MYAVAEILMSLVIGGALTAMTWEYRNARRRRPIPVRIERRPHRRH